MRTTCGIVLLLAMGSTPARADQGLLDAELIHVWGGPFLCDDGNPTAGYREYECGPLQDNLFTTGWDVAGVENFRFQNGVWIDTGGMMLLEFMTAVEAASVHLDLTLRAYDPDDVSLALLMSADQTLWTHESLWSSDDAVQRMVGSFDRAGNTFGGRPTDTIEQIRLPGNRYRFLVWGPHLAAIHDDGAQGLQLFEAHLRYTPVPEPSMIVSVLGTVFVVLGMGVVRQRTFRC